MSAAPEPPFRTQTDAPPDDGTRTAPPSDEAGTRTHSPQQHSPMPGPMAPRGYVLEDKLGEGGMGVVYKARQLGLNRPVALKMVLAAADAKALIRFLAEAEAVVTIHEWGMTWGN